MISPLPEISQAAPDFLEQNIRVACRGLESLVGESRRESFAQWLVANKGRDIRFLGKCLDAAWKLDRIRLRELDHEWDAALGEGERRESREGGRLLALSLKGALHLGVGAWLIHDREAGLVHGHLIPLFAARAVAYHIPPVVVANAYLFQRWRQSRLGGTSDRDISCFLQSLPDSGVHEAMVFGETRNKKNETP